MDFKQAIIRCVKDKYAEFGGRAGREEFWYFMLGYFILSVVLGILHLQIIGGLVFLGLVIPMLAAGSRRLHDVDKSGWMQLISLVPIIGWILVIYWLALPSGGPNRYGDGPAPADAAPAVPPAA